ncbi:hypothetical protein [Nonomuraea helvata]|uniref:Uncharacterized protein n=1 Tax=Nonomuraea helvata TaxID=37484 RepID=A0ABV5SCL2_9ACTN
MGLSWCREPPGIPAWTKRLTVPDSEARRRGQVREDFVLEGLYWEAGTARLLRPAFVMWPSEGRFDPQVRAGGVAGPAVRADDF